ncbi:hypothetical protein [Faecalimonas sp.]
MGSLILCHRKKAKQPYEITRIHKKIYTLEELCYYICNFMYLVDDTLVNKKLCKWLEEELEKEKLAKQLNDCLKSKGTIEQFILYILKDSDIYTAKEISVIEGRLNQLKNQKEIEKKKYKADSLLKSGEIEEAIRIYLSLLHGEEDQSVDSQFYGRVYGCLGTAYGKLFLYREASDRFLSAFQICEEKSMLYAYVYCCRHYMKDFEYEKLLTNHELFKEADSFLTEKEKEEKSQISIKNPKEIFDSYKQVYKFN